MAHPPRAHHAKAQASSLARQYHLPVVPARLQSLFRTFAMLALAQIDARQFEFSVQAQKTALERQDRADHLCRCSGEISISHYQEAALSS